MKLPFKVDQSKLERQKQCLRAWRDNKYKGTIEAATAFGKTFMGILAHKEMLHTLNSSSKTGVIVPTDYLRNKWNEEKKLHNISNLEVNTINTWINRLDEGEEVEFDLLILDEIHGYTGGEVWSTIFDRVKYKRILGLTAKERNKEEDQQVLENYAPIVERVPMKECLENGWVAPFIIYNLGLDLSLSDKEKYNNMHQKFIKYFSTFDFDLNKMFACLHDEQIREKVARSLNWKPKVVLIHAAQGNRVMQKRKQFLYTNDVIFDKSIEVINHLSDRRIITFSEVTSFADRLGKAIPNSVVYHSSLDTQIREVVGKDDEGNELFGEIIAEGKVIDKKGGGNKTVYVDESGTEYSWKEIKKAYPDKKLRRFSGNRRREESLQKFKDGEVDIIHSATALNEGVDIHGIDASVKNSFNSTTIDSIQRTGRTARKDESNPNKQALEVNLFIRDTQSEKWLKKSQRETPNVKYIESIAEII